MPTGLVIALAPLGLLVGAGLMLMGALILRKLVRAKVPWWPSVAAPLLLYGVAIGLLLASWWDGGPILFGAGENRGVVNAAWTLLIFFAATSVLAVARKFMQSRVVREELGIQVPDLLLDGARYLLWVVMVFVLVGGVWGRTDLFSPLFTASAVGTVVLGLALQETLANFFAGVSLLTEHIYAPGDWVVVGDTEGEVVRMSRRSTQLRTRSYDIVTLPNRSVAGGVVRNLSRPNGLHAESIVLSAPYDAPPNKVREVLAAAARACPQVLAEPATRIRLQSYGDSGINYQIRFFVSDMASIPDIRSAVQVQIWYHFRRAGISFPFPVREVRQLPPAEAPGLSPEAVRAHLKGTELFGALPDDVLEDLALGTLTLDYGDGEWVVREGDAGDTCYLVEQGCMVVSVGGQGAMRKVAELGPGAVFGEMSVLTGEPRTASVSASGDARLLAISAKILGHVLAAQPELAGTLAGLMALRKEGLTAARAQLDADTRQRVGAERVRLSAVIRRFLHLKGGA